MRKYVDVRFYLADDTDFDQVVEKLQSEKPERLDLKAVSWRRLKYGYEGFEPQEEGGEEERDT